MRERASKAPAVGEAEQETRWRGIYQIAAVTAFIGIALVPVQLVVFIVWPPPGSVIGFFQVFQRSALIGLLNLDLLYIVNNMLLVPLYLAMYYALRRGSESLATLALALGLVGAAAYFGTNPAFEMMDLSAQYAAATTEAGRATFIAAGEALLAHYTGTAFNVYYILNAIALLLFAGVMFRGETFTRLTAWAGILAGIFMLVPSCAGALGLIFSLASLIPWAAFTILVALRLLRLGRK